MTALRSWLVGIFAAALVLCLVQALVPKGAFEKLVRMLSGIVMVLVILRPLVQLDWESVTDIFAGAGENVQSKMDTYREDLLEEESKIIAGETAAYIAKTAGTMGITCTAEVQCEVRDGVPYPAAVRLDVPYCRALSEKIASDLAIPEEEQYWRGEVR